MINDRRRETRKGLMNDLLAEGKGLDSNGDLPAWHTGDPALPSLEFCPHPCPRSAARRALSHPR